MHGTCVESCPPDTAIDDEQLICFGAHCHQSCLTCFGPESVHCNSCREGSLLVNNSCVPHCDSCSQCKSGYYLLNVPPRPRCVAHLVLSLVHPYLLVNLALQIAPFVIQPLHVILVNLDMFIMHQVVHVMILVHLVIIHLLLELALHVSSHVALVLALH